jgi:hypothetical protein
MCRTCGDLDEMLIRSVIDIASCAEMMPAVTVPPRPNGLPIASTRSPTRGVAFGKLYA